MTDENALWGGEANRRRVAALVNRRADGNYAGAKNGVAAPKEPGGFRKRIALTFDDGPSIEHTPRVLDALAKHSMAATFFVHGELIRGEEELSLLNRMRREGHIVANHAERHSNFARRIEQLAESVEGTHARIASFLPGKPWFFRFPGGNASERAVRIVEGLGYSVVGWHVDSADWCFASAQGGEGTCSAEQYEWVPDHLRRDMAGFILHQLQRTGGGVVLFHDNREFTAQSLDGVLTRLTDEGFVVTGLDDADAFPTLNGWAANLTP